MSNPQGSPFAHLLRGIGNVFRGAGEYPPDIPQDVATGLVAAQWRQSGGEQPIYSNPNLWQGFNYRPTPIPQVPVIQPTPIHQYTPSTVVRGALRRVESQRPQAHQSSGYTGGNPLAGMVNQAASNPIHQSQRAIEQAPYTQHAGGQSASSELFRQALDPNFGRSGSSPIQEDWTQVQNHLSHAGRPLTQADMYALHQQQAMQMQQQQAMLAQLQSAQAQREHHEAQLREMRHRQYQETQAQQQQPLQARVQQSHYQGINLPQATYRDKNTRKEIDLWKEVTHGNDLSDPQLDQFIHSINMMQYSAQTPYELMDAEVINNMARESVIENKLTKLEEVEPGYWEYNGMLLESEEAALAVELDVDHYWKHNIHLTPEKIKEKLKDIAVDTWNFLYGDDINTLLDPGAHPVAKLWTAAQFIPTMKVTKAGKAVKLLKFETPLFPIMNAKPGGPIWSVGKSKNRFKNAVEHARNHSHEFPELGIQSAKQYVQKAWEFYRNPPHGTLTKVLPNGQRMLYHPPSNTILFTDRYGVPATMYKPKAGIAKFHEPKNEGFQSVILRRR